MASNGKQRRIRQITDEIAQVEDYYFSFVDAFEGDPDAQIYALKMKQAFIVRALVMEQHLSIEDAIDALLKRLFVNVDRVKKLKAKQAVAYLRRLVPETEQFFGGNASIGFKQKAILLRMMGQISPTLLRDLEALNTLRNRCAHRWTIAGVVRRNKQKNQPKKFVLAYEGRSLFVPDHMIEFLNKYRDVYFKILDLTYGVNPWDLPVVGL